MTSQAIEKLTAKKYLSMERLADIKSEFYQGEIFAMAGASRKHNQITSNLIRILGNQTENNPCSVYSSDMKVKIEALDKYTYPDIVISCDKEVFEDESEDVLLTPLVIIEVLSESTEAYDRGDKFFHYQKIKSLSEYILVSQKNCLWEHYIKQAEGEWIYHEFHQLDNIVNFKTIDCFVSLSDVYSKVFPNP